MMISSQDSNTNFFSGRSTSSPALIDSQTFASARSFAKQYKSQKKFKESNKLHNLLSGRLKENVQAGVGHSGVGSSMSVDLQHIQNKLGNTLHGSRNNYSSGQNLNPIQNFPTINYL